MSLPFNHLYSYQPVVTDQTQPAPLQQTPLQQGQLSLYQLPFVGVQQISPQPMLSQPIPLLMNPDYQDDQYYQQPTQQQLQQQQLLLQHYQRNMQLQQETPVYYAPNIPVAMDQQQQQQQQQQYQAQYGSGPTVGSNNYSTLLSPYPPNLYLYQPVYQNQRRPMPSYDLPYQQVLHRPQLPNISRIKSEPIYMTHYSTESEAANFKPIQTKRNSRPRINKINKIDAKKRDSSAHKPILGEMSIDDLFNHFQDVLKIKKTLNKDRVVKSSYQLSLKSTLECQLFDLFVNTLSKSIDAFLPQEVFRKVIPELALHDETHMILDSLFCLSSLMLQRFRPELIDPSVPMKYYHQSIKSIRYYLSIPGIENNDKGIISRCLLSTILLCIYELFFVAVDSTYVKGASSLLSSIIITQNQHESLLNNSPFHETCFWAVFVCDMILSLKYNQPSMYSVDKFWRPLDPDYFECFDIYPDIPIAGAGDKDAIIDDILLSPGYLHWWMHKAVITLSLINDFNNNFDVMTREDYESNQSFSEWLDLKKMIDEFEHKMPLCLKPTIYQPGSIDRIFPLVYFRDDMTAIIALNFRLAKIALYESLIKRSNTDLPMVQDELKQFGSGYTQKIAKDVVGIMKTYDANVTIWPVNIHAIRQVARYLTDDPDAMMSLEDLVLRIIEVCRLRLKGK